MGNFCTNCGAKLENDYNYCINCGVKIEKSHTKQIFNSVKSELYNNEKEKARNELKRVVGGKILFKVSFSEELHRNGLGYDAGDLIRQQIEQEIDSGQIKSEDVESRKNQLIHEYKIKNDKRIAEENARKAKEKEMRTKRTVNTQPAQGGYCSFNCIHYREEYLDSGGGIIGDFDMGGYVEYYCNLGHQISNGRYCKDYEL